MPGICDVSENSLSHENYGSDKFFIRPLTIEIMTYFYTSPLAALAIKLDYMITDMEKFTDSDIRPQKGWKQKWNRKQK